MKPKKYYFNISITVEPDGDRFYAYSHLLSGLHMDGKTKEEAFVNAIDGASVLLRSIFKHGESLPDGIEIDTTVKS